MASIKDIKIPKENKRITTKEKGYIESTSIRQDIRLKHILFAEHYLKHGDKIEAYKNAGFRDANKNPSQIGAAAAKVLSHDNVQDYLAKRQDKLREQTDVSFQKWMEEWKNIAFHDVINYLEYDDLTGKIYITDLRKLTPAQRSCIKKISHDKDGRLTIEFYDRAESLKEIGRALGMYNLDFIGARGVADGKPVNNIQNNFFMQISGATSANEAQRNAIQQFLTAGGATASEDDEEV